AVAALGADGSLPVSDLHSMTRGNPFYVTEVLATPGAAVPPTVRDAVLARIEQLPPETRELLEVLSVVPSRIERPLAEELCGADAAEVLRHAEAAGVLQGDAATIWFRHELARRAVEGSLTTAEVLAHNRRILALLVTDPGADAARIVHHAERAGDVQALLRHGPEAARQAVRVGSHRQAIEMLSRVLAHADLLPPMDAAALRAARGYSLYLVNRFEDSYSDSVAAVEAASEAGGGDVLIEALSVLSKAAFWARGPHVAQDAAARAVELLTDAAGEGGDHLAGDARMASALGDLARAHSNL